MRSHSASLRVSSIHKMGISICFALFSELLWGSNKQKRMRPTCPGVPQLGSVQETVGSWMQLPASKGLLWVGKMESLGGEVDLSK